MRPWLRAGVCSPTLDWSAFDARFPLTLHLHLVVGPPAVLRQGIGVRFQLPPLSFGCSDIGIASLSSSQTSPFDLSSYKVYIYMFLFLLFLF